MIVYSQNYVVFPPLPESQIELNNPLVGYQNVVTSSSLAADTEQDGYPVSNLATPVTYQRWRGELDVGNTQFITVTTTDVMELIDYLAVAGHNFATSQHSVWVEGATDLDSDGNPDWFEITNDVIPSDDGPLLFRFEPRLYIGLRLAMLGGSADPYAAVMYAGKLLVLPRRIYVGHAPINLNRKSDILTGRGETGQFLGRIARRQSSATSVSLKNISPSFYRSDIRPWIEAAETQPFFFAWRPFSYPLEVGYCWAMDDVPASNEKANSTMQFSMTLQGIVK